MFNLYRRIKELEIETSSECNSMCPGCERTAYDFNLDVLATNRSLPKSQFLNPSIIKNISECSLIHAPDIILAGSFSDPLMHPGLHIIIKEISTHIPNARLTMYTNGGARNSSYVYELAKHFSKPGYKMIFCIDGLEDTNKLYRHGVDFDKAIDNMKAAKNAGANVIWLCIRFPWIKHQESKIKEYAKQLGIHLQFRDPRPDDYNSKKFIAARENRVSFKRQTSEKVITPSSSLTIHAGDYLKYDYINPSCVSRGRAFVGFDNKLYLCCTQFSAKYDVYSALFNTHMDFDSNWNSLEKYNMNDIIQHRNWKLMTDTIQQQPFSYCAIECGECK